MFDQFPKDRVAHVAHTVTPGDAAHRVLSAQDFADAWAQITSWPGYVPTPLVSLANLAAQIGVGAIHYKDEGPRFGLGSFKALGGAYAAMRLIQREVAARTGQTLALDDIAAGRCREACAGITLVSATDGNHGRSLAWGCHRVGAPCRIYIHAEVSEGRADAMRAYGAKVVRIDGDYDASVALARDEAAANGWFVVSDTSWPGYTEPPRDVMAGYGVMAREAAEAMDASGTLPTHVIVQGGVGGYAAAVAAYFRQHWGAGAPRVLVVEPDRAACLFASAKAGALTNVAIEVETIMAGLSCGEPSPLAWEVLAEQAGDFLTIPDAFVPPAMRLLAKPLGGDTPIQAGESAVGGVAALIAVRGDAALSAQLGLDAASRVVIFGTEGVTDPDIYARIMAGEEAA
ncbi:MAG: diaminopropionate ammonia-lyase [Pseudomonadota bacterium]